MFCRYSWFCFRRHDYIQNRTRTVVIVCDTFPGKFEEGITYIQVLDTNRALAFMGLIISVTRLKN
jgi:hypothetical protein